LFGGLQSFLTDRLGLALSLALQLFKSVSVIGVRAVLLDLDLLGLTLLNFYLLHLGRLRLFLFYFLNFGLLLLLFIVLSLFLLLLFSFYNLLKTF
jgi:hypothetical protein